MSTAALAIAYAEATLRKAAFTIEAPEATSADWLAFLSFRAEWARLMRTRAQARRCS